MQSYAFVFNKEEEKRPFKGRSDTVLPKSFYANKLKRQLTAMFTINYISNI